jgi:uncharacterized SAM-binding protein YcdF (DUF218 family)
MHDVKNLVDVWSRPLSADISSGVDYVVVLGSGYRPRDPVEEAHAAARLIGNRRFILVTSAYHMPRAMR